MRVTSQNGRQQEEEVDDPRWQQTGSGNSIGCIYCACLHKLEKVYQGKPIQDLHYWSSCDTHMDILRKYQVTLANVISAVDIAESFKVDGIFDYNSVDLIKSKHGKKARTTELLRLLAERNDKKGIIKFFDMLVMNHPQLHEEMPEIFKGERIQIPLGNNRLLKVTKWNDELRVDIREYEVRCILFSFILLHKPIFFFSLLVFFIPN